VSTLEQDSAELQFRAAMERRDLAAVLDTFAPDAVFRSPLTDKLTFTGHEQIAAVTEVVLDVFDELHYTDELHAEGDGYLVGRARIGGQPLEWVDHLRLGPDGKIQELTVFFRPLPATATALRLIGVGLTRRKSPLRAAVISALARPLAVMTRAGDGIGVRLVRPTL
jgi:ketosteroid isomerase-like protein